MAVAVHVAVDLDVDVAGAVVVDVDVDVDIMWLALFCRSPGCRDLTCDLSRRSGVK